MIQKYLIKKYLFYLLVILLIISTVLFLFDFIELTRITISKNVSMGNVLLLAAQKNPLHIQKVFGFIVLIAAMLTYMQLSKNNELIIFKSAGLSTYQFLLPIIILAAVIGIIYSALINPLTTILTIKYLKNEAIYLKGNPSLISVSKTGLWIKQVNNSTNECLIHALKIDPEKKQLHEVTFFYLNKVNGFTKRIDADKAEILENKWILDNARETSEDNLNKKILEISLPTNLNFEQIQKSLVPPESLSIWKLPYFISIAESSGLPAIRHKLYLYRLFINPIFFAAMVILGASFSMTSARFNKNNLMLILVLVIGFFIYFFSDLIFAFGSAGTIPLWFATIAPSLLALFIGILMVLNFEEVRT